MIVTHDQEEALTLADRIVIMRNGRLEQVGTPQEIYAQPKSRFVAGFIGASNFLRGQVAGRDGTGTIVTLAGGACLTLPGAPPAEPEVLLAIRPEAVRIAPGAPEADATNAAAGSVEQMIYRGGLTHIYLRLDGGDPLLALHQNRAGERGPPGLVVGGRVTAHWRPEDNHMVADG